MSCKRPGCVKNGPVAKRKRKAITLELKLDVLRRYNRGERTADIGRLLGLNESTLRTIRDNADKIHKSCKTATHLNTCRVTPPRSSIMEKMESRLIEWLVDQQDQNFHVSSSATKEMAKRLYEDLKNSEPDAEVKPFTASSGWFERFKVRRGSQKLKTTEPSYGADTFHEVFRSIVEEDGYSAKQVFSLGETVFYWKRMPKNTFASSKDRQGDGLTPENDHCTLLLGGNALGDCKLKPVLIYHTENPRVLKGYSKMHLPVVWRSSKRGTVTSTIFADYFGSHLHQELKAYCERENLPFKILLLLEIASGYPSNLADLSNNIKVLFKPASTSPLMQPMEEGVMTMFKAFYLRCVFARLITETHVGGKLTVPEFWQTFSIKTAIDVIGEAWTEVSEQVMNEAWRILWPDVIKDSQDLTLDENIKNVGLSIVDLAKSVGFTNVEEKNVQDLLDSHGAGMNNEDLPQLGTKHDNEGDESGSEADSVRTLSTEVLGEIFRLVDQVASLIDENDPDRERSSHVAREQQNVLACYKDLYRHKLKHATHLSLDRFVVKCE